MRVTRQGVERTARGFVVATQVRLPAQPPARLASLRGIGKVARHGAIGGRGFGVAARGFGNAAYGVAGVRGARLERILRGQANEDGQGLGILVSIPQRASPAVQGVHGLRRVRVLRDDAPPFVHRGFDPVVPRVNVGQQQQAVRTQRTGAQAGSEACGQCRGRGRVTLFVQQPRLVENLLCGRDPESLRL